MLRKLLFLSLSVFLFTGCSSVQPPSNLSRLQIKMAHLEKRVEENEKRIKEVEFNVKQTSEHVDGLETYNDYEPVVEIKEKKVSTSKTYKTKPAKKTGIIRVSKSVKTIQEALENAGYYSGPIDGKIGGGTQRAIVEFQKDHDLVADGVVGSKTWSEMKNYLE